MSRSKATETAVLHADFEMVSQEEPSYFDEVLFLRLGSVGDANNLVRIQHGELQLKRSRSTRLRRPCSSFATRELDCQIMHEFDRFSKYLVKVKPGAVY